MWRSCWDPLGGKRTLHRRRWSRGCSRCSRRRRMSSPVSRPDRGPRSRSRPHHNPVGCRQGRSWSRAARLSRKPVRSAPAAPAGRHRASLPEPLGHPSRPAGFGSALGVATAALTRYPTSPNAVTFPLVFVEANTLSSVSVVPKRPGIASSPHFCTILGSSRSRVSSLPLRPGSCGRSGSLRMAPCATRRNTKAVYVDPAS